MLSGAPTFPKGPVHVHVGSCSCTIPNFRLGTRGLCPRTLVTTDQTGWTCKPATVEAVLTDDVAWCEEYSWAKWWLLDLPPPPPELGGSECP